ncbi:chondroitin sulfate synthase 1 isoform X2 [Mobula hypostoma]|uniref:chondroitin sulfate synthase 1 isoform X2 n=1 Tax=Mobula hypostoma TaxID=723540 RepID=UPI002FC3A2C6
MAPRCRRSWLSVLLGLVLGFALASWLVLPRAPGLGQAQRQWVRAVCGRQGPGAGQLHPSSPSASEASASRFMYVGVMSAKKYLRSRALAAYRTWARHIPGRVEFFSSEGSDLSLPLPLVALPGVDDTYPPQKKSFLMLKYMAERHLQQFEWFVRADDDTYIRGEKLESFLRGLNSSQPLYLGQTGLGAPEEMGKLALEPGENFCMGGPGVVLSRELLRRVLPHIGQCLREMYTTHEDLELGRCVRRFAGVQCAWSYETAMKQRKPRNPFKERHQTPPTTRCAKNRANSKKKQAKNTEYKAQKRKSLGIFSSDQFNLVLSFLICRPPRPK